MDSDDGAPDQPRRPARRSPVAAEGSGELAPTGWLAQQKPPLAFFLELSFFLESFFFDALAELAAAAAPMPAAVGLIDAGAAPILPLAPLTGCGTKPALFSRTMFCRLILLSGPKMKVSDARSMPLLWHFQ